MFPSLTGLPTPLVLLVAAVVLAAESGLMVGVVLPGATTRWASACSAGWAMWGSAAPY